jgi:hypothetical protein
MKKYTLMREVTDYGDTIKGGIYICEDKPKGRVWTVKGYLNHITDEVKWFTNALKIDTKGRQFVKV